jgi:hypothetical protein
MSKRGRSGRQTKSGASGSELLVSSEQLGDAYHLQRADPGGEVRFGRVDSGAVEELGQAAASTSRPDKLTDQAHQAGSKSGSARRTASKSSRPVMVAPSVSRLTGAKSPLVRTAGRPANCSDGVDNAAGVRGPEPRGPASRGCREAYWVRPPIVEPEPSRGQPAERGQQLSHRAGDLRKASAAGSQLARLRDREARQGVVDHRG